VHEGRCFDEEEEGMKDKVSCLCGVRLFWVLVLLGSFFDLAHAQVGLQLPPTRDDDVRGIRYRGLIFVPYLGIEGGYNSNLFRMAPEEGIVGAGILGVTPGLKLTNETPNIVKMKWEASGTIYKYFSDNATAREQGRFGMSSALRGEFLPKSVIGFFVADQFSRQIVPTNYPGVVGYDRNLNHAEVGLQIRPGGGALVLAPSYAFNFALYDDKTELDLWGHEARLLATWDVLPKTMVFLDIDWHAKDWRQPLPGAREDSKPIKIAIGMKGFVTRKLAITASGGFAKTFFKKGAEYTGFVADIGIGLKPTHYSFAEVGYKRTVDEWFWGNFMAADWAYLNVGVQLLRRVNLLGSLQYKYARYGSVDTTVLSNNNVTYVASQSARRDHLLDASALVSWSIMRYVSVEAGYGFLGAFTDFYLQRTSSGNTITDYGKFKQHMVFGRVKAIY
jgi:hypothetical protein